MAEVLYRSLAINQKHAALWNTIVFICLVLLVAGQAESKCNIHQFRCEDGSCILQEKMCNGHKDCADNSDETDCDLNSCDSEHWFQCDLPQGPCLASELVCNGIDNCPGGEDEEHCGGSHERNSTKQMDYIIWSAQPRNCSEFEYTCKTDKNCIPLDFICNGNVDCKDRSDETDGCDVAKTNCKGFFCDNNKCLESSNWICDGVNDCGDNSDERYCMNHCKLEQHKYACRDNRTCIDLLQVCDNVAQCPDGSDESSAICKSTRDNCSNKKCPTSAKCHMLPDSGATCICPKGYQLSNQRNVCIDIDECFEQHGLCSQLCVNKPGTYNCQCDEGYRLKPDNHSCEAISGHPLLLYTTQVTVMSVHLRSKHVQTIARNLSKVIGVAYDGKRIYWTNIQNEAESIVRANADGSEQEILLTSGLDAPEDLAVDWLTGNLYFSDNIMQHIAACTNDGIYCTILVTEDVNQPRGIALWPQIGLMFWTDWGDKPMIARAGMDGSGRRAIISDKIHWPNGIALDMHNNRIYWVDAKLSTVESARSDGSDRRLVLQDLLKHPYGLAVFEEKLYWSDWATKSVHSCNKFTGKDHNILVKDRTIYAVHIYHAAKQPNVTHACTKSQCSHICLLAENHSYRCACPENMHLSADQKRCIKTYKHQRLFMGLRNTLLEMEHTTFGRHMVQTSHVLSINIHEMVYNNVNGTLIIYDNLRKSIYEYDGHNNSLTLLTSGNMGNVSGLAFDHLSYSVYWTDSEYHVVEMLSLRTLNRAVVSFFSGLETPIAICLVPEDGIMFVALRNHRMIHIDQLKLNGKGDHVHVFEEDLGNREIKFAVDYESKTLYWSDSDLGSISFSDYHSLHAFTFRSRLRRPYALALVDGDLFWSELKSSTIHWTHKNNMGALKRIDIESSKDSTYKPFAPARLPLLATTPAFIVDHACQHENGRCSHICVTINQHSSSCLCPAGYVFKDLKNHTCIEQLDCEFRCRTGECLTMSHRCNSHRDCPDGSDEENCNEKSAKKAKIICNLGEMSCHNGEQCIEYAQRCDDNKDCNDGSDEEHCERFDANKKCHHHQYLCENEHCVDFSAVCDGVNDCEDNSDEKHCTNSNSTQRNCGKDMFQCSVGTCIPKQWECDAKIDCVDASDEHANCDLKDCPAKMHRCLLGQCLDEKFKCDGNNDCGDYSDELNCDASGNKNLHSCADNQFQCKSNTSICLKQTARCNGTAECPRGEDEADCGELCSFNEYQCKTSKHCIRMEFRCDHERDCKDGSDELNCDYARNSSLTHESVCEAGMFDCKDGKCVDQSRVCNNFADCDNEADEGPLCTTACKNFSGKSTVCDHKCKALPTGALCSCFTGYALANDQRSCNDINECELHNPCAQLCENTRGSYRCSCYADFMLRTDKTTCKSIESEYSLLFSSYNEVRSMSEHPVTLKVAFAANDSKIMGFDLNIKQRMAYFTTDTEDVIYSYNITSGLIEAALSMSMPTKVGVDWVTGNVYVVSRAQRYEIHVCSFKASMCGRLLDMKNHEVVKALTIDGYNRKMFFVTIHTLSFGFSFSQINIANLDGKQREFLVLKNGGYISALSVDPHKKHLYYVDMHTKTLQFVAYAAGSTRTPRTIIQKGNIIMHPSGLSVYENQAFIVNIGAKEAMRCNLFADYSCKSFNLNILNAENILVDGQSRQPLNKNPCAMAACTGLCVQSEFSYECLCGNQFVAEGVVCDKSSSNGILKYSALSGKTTKGGFGTGKILSLIFLIIIMIIITIGYLYYRRSGQGHRDFNINLHFQNPLSSTEDSKCSATYSIPDTNTQSFDKYWQKNRYSFPTLQKLLRRQSQNNGTEILLQPSEPSEVCALGETEPTNVVDAENFTEYGGNKSAGRESRTRLIPNLI